MKLSLWLPISAATALLASSCASNKGPDDGLGYGPFDADGTYREDLADNPSSWTKPGQRGKTTTKPAPTTPAASDSVPANSTPLVVRNDNVSHPQPLVTSKPKTTTVVSKPKTSTSTKVVSKPKTTTSKTVAKAKVKPTQKKPTTTRYTVKRGDSLSSIAARNGTTVSAIKRQNGLKSDLIIDGKALVIPKR